jgi:hypothetical protein
MSAMILEDNKVGEYLIEPLDVGALESIGLNRLSSVTVWCDIEPSGRSPPEAVPNS